jgi:hypothetical protein
MVIQYRIVISDKQCLHFTGAHVSFDQSMSTNSTVCFTDYICDLVAPRKLVVKSDSKGLCGFFWITPCFWIQTTGVSLGWMSVSEVLSTIIFFIYGIDIIQNFDLPHLWVTSSNSRLNPIIKFLLWDSAMMANQNCTHHLFIILSLDRLDQIQTWTFQSQD